MLSGMLNWVFYKELRVTPQGNFSFDLVYQKVAQRYPHQAITAIYMPDCSKMTSAVIIENPNGGEIERIRLYCNPYTGEILAKPYNFKKIFSAYMSRIHTSLYLGRTGAYVVCIVGLFLFKIVLFSVPLLPMSLPSMFWVRITKGKKILYKDLHKFLGVWGFIFVFIIGGTSTWYLAKRVLSDTGNFSKVISFRPKSTTPAVYQSKLVTYPKQLKVVVNFDQIVQQVTEKLPNFWPTRIMFNANKRGPCVLYGREGALTPNRGTVIYIDPFNGEILEIRSYQNATRGEKWMSTMDILHFGYFWGVTSKILWGIFGTFLVLLSFTGLVIRWNSVSRTKDKRLGYLLYPTLLVFAASVWYVVQNVRHNDLKVVESIKFKSSQSIFCELRKSIPLASSSKKTIYTLYVYFQNGLNIRNVQDPVEVFLSGNALKSSKQNGVVAIFMIENTQNLSLKKLSEQLAISVK